MTGDVCSLSGDDKKIHKEAAHEDFMMSIYFSK